MRSLLRPLDRTGSIYLIVCVASTVAALVGVAALFDDGAPAPHAEQRAGASLAWSQAR